MTEDEKKPATDWILAIIVGFFFGVPIALAFGFMIYMYVWTALVSVSP